MSEMLRYIAEKIERTSRRTVLVSDPDGLLAKPEVCARLAEVIERRVLRSSGLRLRVDYELWVRPNPDAKVCYVVDDIETVMPDIRSQAWQTTISITELFPNFADKNTLKNQSFEVLSNLYSRHIQGRVSAERLATLLAEGKTVGEPESKSDMEIMHGLAEATDWSDLDFVETLGKTLRHIFESRSYDAEAIQIVDDLNFDFQHYLKDCYFPMLNSSGSPKAVHMVAPYLQNRFGIDDKVCFVVVDGMAWWQWEVLREELEKRHLLPMPEVRPIMAWLPSITALSRQALFRGGIPTTDYRQTPADEEKLWKRLWQSNPIYAPVYQHNIQRHDDLNLNTRRLALVDTALDKKMHQSSDYYDLHDLTRNWAVKFSETIRRLLQEDFRIVLTTDHGNVLAHGSGTLSPEEKAHLYLANSRGERFVYFQKEEQKFDFLKNHKFTQFFSNAHENWLAIADGSSFSTSNKQLITHGGSHFMETIIPLITI